MHGCAAVGPEYAPPAVELLAAYANASAAAFSSEAVEAAWWRQFGDPVLSDLIDRTLGANHDIGIALGRLEAARAALSEADYERYPRVTAGASAAVRRLSEAQAPGRTLEQRDNPLFTTGFDAFWEIDLFGRLRRLSQAASAGAEAAHASLRDVRVSVIAEVARVYFELRGTEWQLAVARQNVENQKETLAVTQVRLQLGRGTDLDTARAEAQLKLTEASVPPLEAAVKRAEYRLAVLLGERPGRLGIATDVRPLPALDRRFPIGDAGDLLRRRPDIRAAERNVAAATARIGLSAADLFPRLSVTGFLGLIATSASGMGTAGGVAYTLGPTLTWAAFDPRLRARVQGAEAQAEIALEFYEQTVLRALEETENAFVAFGREQARLLALRQSAQASASAAALARLRFDFGTSDFLTVLDAERTRIDALDRVAQTETQLYTALIAIYKALGGGWEVAEAADTKLKETR